MKRLKDYLIIEVTRGKSKLFLLRLSYIYFFGAANLRALLIYRIGNHLFDKKYRKSSRFFFAKLERTYNVFIHPRAVIGIGLKLPHPTGIVLGAGAVIGEKSTIYQQVTFGGGRIGDAKKESYPIVGDNCIFYAGAKLLGKIKIGNNCIIGANAVVLADVPDNCTAVGVPARTFLNKTAK